ncbi:hypothetical protein L0128_07815 [candidate division KSB1 bacterium]|nr:hypothetical protein [candidate division KSB1 bacterium]
MNNRLKLLVFYLCILYGLTFANSSRWQTYTNMYDIRDLVIQQDNLWCATNGGVFKYNLRDSSFQLFTNIEGLSALDVRTIETDAEGDIWIGTFSGAINLLHVADQRFELIDDFDRHIINDIVVLNNDSLLIAFDNGIGLYVKPDREVKESYYSLGYGLETKIAVNCLLVHGKEIWAGTSTGIARTSLERINLKDPASWINYTTNTGLPGNNIRDLNVIKNEIFAITERGIGKFDGSSWSILNDGLPAEKIDQIYSFFPKSDTLYIAAVWGIYRFDPQANWWYHVGKDLLNSRVMTMDTAGQLWVGRANLNETGGLAVKKLTASEWQLLYPPGPPSNKFNDIAIDKTGRWWIATTDAGVVRYDGQEWTSFNLKTGFPSNYYQAIAVDGFNRIWAGSTGRGLARIDVDGKFHFFQTGFLSGAAVDPNFIIIDDIAVDSKNNVWVTNRLAADNNILAVVTPDSQWYRFSKIETNAVSKLIVDRYDRIWISTDRLGLFVLDYNGTLATKTDDNFNQGYNESEGLWSNYVTAFIEDLEGTVWIGTDKGLNYWYTLGGVTRLDSFYYNLISNNIKTLTVDAQNNIWVGTGAGLSMIPASDRFRPINYTTQNSPLISDEIQTLTFNPNTGALLIGTPAGLSVLETGFTATKYDNYSQLKIYPNPFHLGTSGNELVISNLARNSVAVKLFTLNGALVRSIPLDDPTKGGFGGQAIWNGLNEKNEPVTSGIYLILAYTEDGSSHVAKVAVIRE